VKETLTTPWRVEAGHRPTVEGAEKRLPHVREHGATAHAFTLRTSFPPPVAG
jgi:hypothetical protein